MVAPVATKPLGCCSVTSAIPKDATITDAFIQFRADNSHSDAVDLKVQAEDSGTSADFSTSNSDISDRDTTYASAFWQPPAWTTNDMDAPQKCTGLENVVQEVVTHADWTTSSPLTFIITGTGRREAEGYSSSSLWKNTYTYIEYNDQMAQPPNEPPTVSLTNPSDGAVFTELSTITLSADASDPDGNLSGVEFFVDGQSVGSVSSSPFELNWDIPDYGSYGIHAVATDDEGLMANSLTANINVFANVIDIQISEKNDDVEELENGAIWKNNKDLELCYDDYVSNSQGLVGHQHIGLRFQNVNIPQGAAISNAYIQFTADETDSETTEVIIKGEDVDDAGAFSYSTNDVSSRNMTADSVTWSPPAWDNVGAAGTDERTPDISPVIQNIVDRNGWTAGNSMVLILYGYDQLKRVAESYDGMASGAAKLHIEFSNAPQNLVRNQSNINAVLTSFKAYPNPIRSSILTVEFSKNSDAAFAEIIDAMGRRIASKSLDTENENQLEFKIHNWPAGLYFIKVKNKDGSVESKRIIVE